MTAETATPVEPPVPTRAARWRRRLSFLPLLLLAIASVAAGAAGVQTRAAQAEHVVPTPDASAAADPVADVCRPAVDAPDQEPWLAGDGSAEQIWQEHADEVGLDYLRGPNGWTFWSDYVEQYASQAVGRATLSAQQVANWVAYYSSLRDGLAAEGIEFYIIVTPSTSSVYPEELPEWMQGLRGSTIMDQFMASAGDLPVIDLRQPLIDAKTPDVHLFSWSNSHWTDFGGYVGWERIAECVDALYPGEPELQVPEVTGSEVIGDFNEWAPYDVPSPGEDWAVPVYAEPLPDYTVTDATGTTATVDGTTKLDLLQLPAETTVERSWTGKSALILRDSMGSSLSPYWAQAYSPTWQVHHQYAGFASFPDYRSLIAEHHPDVVILQLAERHLVNAPPDGARF